MAFIDDEKSVSDSAPVELYTFVTNVGTFRRTSLNIDVIHGGNTYAAVPLMRTRVEVNATDQAQEIVIDLPASDAVVKNHMPILPDTFTCLVQRKQLVSGQVQTIWDGLATSITVKGRVASMRIPSVMDDALSTPIPSAYFQVVCNHILYDARCRFSRGTFGMITTVISASGSTVTLSSDGGNQDQWFRGGDLLRVADGTRRLILDHTGDVLTLARPLPSMAFPYSVDIAPGCDHTIRTCRDKFNNVLNFVGHPYTSVQFVTASRLREKLR